MKTDNEIKIFLVDDDALFLKVLEIELGNIGNFIVESFSTGELCLARLSQYPDLVILDYHLDSIDKNAMNGISTLDKIKTVYPYLPVVMLSSQDKIEVAVNCMHHKAFDYVVKSETAFLHLKKIILNVLRYQKLEKELNWYMERM